MKKKRRPLSGLRLAKRRTQVRWNSFIASPGSRLEGMILPRFGPALWGDFVRHIRHYREAYISAFLHRVLSCEGSVDREPCPHSFHVSMSVPYANARLECLHLNHEVNVSKTCNWWHSRLPASPQSWDDGLDRDELCHSLFGVRDSCGREKCVRFRCGPRRSAKRQLRFAEHSYCHVS